VAGGAGPGGCGAAVGPRSGVGCRDRPAGRAGRSGGRVPDDGGGGDGGPGPGAVGGDGRAERAARFLALGQRLRSRAGLPGLVTALASDYLPSGLLSAAFLLAEQGVTTLAAGVRLVTAGAADAVGLADRGRLLEGLRADLVLAQAGQPWPVVRSVLRAETP
jgi:hypothetical protein